MRIIERIPDIGTSLFHFGTNAKQTKEKIGDRVCLMGNLDPVGLLQDGTPERVTEEALRVLEVSAPGGGFVLAAAGAYGIEVSDANIRALLDSVKIYAEQRNRLPLPKL
jgi:uroporphyrinogen decarboxylase